MWAKFHGMLSRLTVFLELSRLTVEPTIDSELHMANRATQHGTGTGTDMARHNTIRHGAKAVLWCQSLSPGTTLPCRSGSDAYIPHTFSSNGCSSS